MDNRNKSFRLDGSLLAAPDKAASPSSRIRSEAALSKARWPERDALGTEIKSGLSLWLPKWSDR